jgi:GNAT superfamily N-acetyltransferase
MKVPVRLKAGVERIRPLDPEHRDAVAAFQRAHYPAGSRQVHPACVEWMYGQNPHAGDAGPGFWVYRRDGEIVGQQGEMPVELQAGGQTRRISWAVDLMVDPAWRLRGLGPALIATLLDSNPLVGVLYASEQGFPAFLRSGLTDVGPMPVYRRPLDMGRALQLPRVPRAVRRVAPLLGPLARLADAGAAGLTRLAGARLVPVEQFDERVDEVWASVAPHHRVIATRDLTALRWRIDQRPDHAVLRRYYLERRGRALGYVVLRPTTSAGERTAIVVDYLAPPRWVAPLLLAAGRAARSEGAVAISVRTWNHGAARSLALAGFSRRFGSDDHPIHLMVHCADDAELCAAVLEPGSWFLTAADSDLESAHPGSPGSPGPEGNGSS